MITPAPVARATNDPAWSRQWAATKIGLDSAWHRSTGQAVRVAVIDTGVDLAHEDLAGQIVANADCRGSGGDASRCTEGGGQDQHGHGTHVAGIIAAVRDNGRGIAGVAPDAKLIVVKALGPDGGGAAADLTGAVRYALDKGAQVINLSIEGDVGVAAAAALRDAVREAWSRGAVPVVASGNSDGTALASGTSDLPAIVVGASGPEDQVPAWSHATGSAQWAILAPGGDGRTSSGEPSCSGDAGLRCIASTYWRAGRSNTYADDEGTSMAAPHVSGVAALLLATGLGPQATVERILATAAKVPCGSGSPTCAGRLDAAAALGGPAPAPPSTTSSTRPASSTTRAPASTSTAPSTTVVAPVTAPVTSVAPVTIPTLEAPSSTSTGRTSPPSTIALESFDDPAGSAGPLVSEGVLLGVALALVLTVGGATGATAVRRR